MIIVLECLNIVYAIYLIHNNYARIGTRYDEIIDGNYVIGPYLCHTSAPCYECIYSVTWNVM